jgi:hypothetical protein
LEILGMSISDGVNVEVVDGSVEEGRFVADRR